MSKKLKKDTISSKAGIATDKEHGSVVPPLYLSSNFAFKKFMALNPIPPAAPAPSQLV